MQALAKPENAHRLQAGLARIAQLGMDAGFSSDADAEMLYEFASWLEERHGRQTVLTLVVVHAAAIEADLLRSLEAALVGLQSPVGSSERVAAARRLHDVRDVVAGDMLDLLCSLGALESDQAPGDDRVSYFASLDLPDRFSDLAAKTAGIGFESGDVTESQEAGLMRFVPSFDPHLRFLTVSHLFFLHSYVARNLIELLPELLAGAKHEPER